MDAALTETEAEAEKERARAWIQFLIQTYTAPSFGKTDPEFDMNKKKFIEAIKPQPSLNEPKKVYEYDENLMNHYKKLQEGG